MKKIEKDYREDVIVLTEKFLQSLINKDLLEMNTMKELEKLVHIMGGIITKKIDDFFRSQFQIFKLNYLLQLSHQESSNRCRETEQSQKVQAEANKEQKQSSSNNSREIDSNSGSNSDLKKEELSSAVSDNTKNKEESKKLPRYASNILREWFSDHINDPYPTKGEKIMLASKTNLSLRQVAASNCLANFFQITNWFVNHRGRKWKERKQKLQFSNQIKTKLMIEGLNQMLSQQNFTNNAHGQYAPSIISQSTKNTLYPNPQSRSFILSSKAKKTTLRKKQKISQAGHKPQPLIATKQHSSYA